MSSKQKICTVCEDASCAKCKKNAKSREHYRLNAERRKPQLRVWQAGYRARNPEKAAKQSKDWLAANGDRYKTPEYRKKQGHSRRNARSKHTPEYFLAKLVEQSFMCPICDRVLDPGHRLTHADHDHVTNKPRGVLCHVCNTRLGMIEKCPQLCTPSGRALEYILQYEAINNPVAAE